MSFGEDNGKRKEEGSAAIKEAGEFLQKLLLIISSRKKKKSPLDKFSFLEKRLNIAHPFYWRFAFQHR